MVGHQWLPRINNPTSNSISLTSAKQEQETSSDCLGTSKKVTCLQICPVAGLSTLCLLLLVTCVALSVMYNNESDRWKSLLFEYQNISDSYLSLSKANNGLKGDNEILKEHRLPEQAELLNRHSAELMSVNLALSLENKELMEKIVNLTSTNLQLKQEHERLARYTSEQEEKKLNMSRTIKYLVDANAQREEEQRRLSETNSLLRDELFQADEKNRELLEMNHKFQGEIKNLSEKIRDLLRDDREKASKQNMQLQERVTELQEQNQNLSAMLLNGRKEAAACEESRRNEMDRTVADMHSMKEAYTSLDLYCPVVSHKTKERVCKKCPDSWKLFEAKCYYFSPRRLTWSSSRAWCQTQGGDLLIINSEPEQNFAFESGQALDSSGSRLWIGMTDAGEEGEWFWVDGSSVSSDVQFWLSRPGMGTEPDDWKLEDPLGEDCGHIDTSETALKSWMDGSCEIPYRWICEKNV